MVFPILGGNSAVGGYAIDNSLRFNDNDSAYLNRTPSSAGDRRTFTLSVWFKLTVSPAGDSNYERQILSADDGTGGNNNFDYIAINNTNKIFIFGYEGAVNQQLTSTQVLRDTSAWYHLVVAFDTTQATASNRIKVYLNGNQITAFDTASYPSLNFQTRINNTNPHYIGKYPDSSTQYFDGYMAEYHFIDGQQLDASSFGEFDEDSGIWKPKQYTGTYGTNGFYLDFENSGSLGADQSGNGNNFTPTNLASTDQTTDTPTNNWCTLNPLDTLSGSTFSEGNLKIDTSVSQQGFTRSTMALQTGKWYFEAKITTSNVREQVGLYKTDGNLTDGTARIAYYSRYGYIYKGNSLFATGATFGNGDIIGTAFDLDASTVSFYKNGTLQGTVTSIDSSTWSPMFGDGSDLYACGAIYNFGNPPTGFTIASGNTDDNGYGNFEYAPPSGYLALCTQNLATELSPTIDDGSAYFQATTYTGDGNNDRQVTNSGNSDLQPDLIWVKNRTQAYNHIVQDTSRGLTTGGYLTTNGTQAESGATTVLVKTATTDGFTVGTSGAVNWSGDNLVGWQWKANAGSTSSNTDGSITSTVQANTTAGFSIVTYTGNSTNSTIGHGLGVTPSFFVTKSRTQGIYGWVTYHQSLGATKGVFLNTTGSQVTDSTLWNNTEPTSSVISLGSNAGTNNNAQNYVMYAFAEIEGYSKFGSYTGNGSTDGTFIYTGFRPAWLMVKRTDTTGSWRMLDATRSEFNAVNDYFKADTSETEGTNNTSYDTDFVSNGFKSRASTNELNASGGTYIYMAFAENPFVTSTGIPVTAR